MPRKITFELPFQPPPELRGNARPAHWSVRHRKVKELRESVWVRLMEGVGSGIIESLPWPRARVTYTSYWCGKPIDEDGLRQGMKAVLDEIVSYGIIKDDSPQYLDGIDVRYVRVKHREDIKVVVEVEEVGA
jgi:hypothetical protein